MEPQVSQSEPAENGNTESAGVKKSNQFYKWSFTLNNWTPTELSQVSQTLRLLAKKAVVGKEVGESGTPHLQGYFSLKKKERLTGLKKKCGFERANFSECRNENALIDYCQKDGDVFLKIGFPKPINIITNLYPWQKQIEELISQPVDDRKIYWFWEQEGNIGKSALVKYLVVKYGAIFCDGGKKSDLINLIFNNDMDTCNVVIWDLPRSNKGMISYSTLESIKNGLVCNTKYETGVKAFNPPHIIVFANFQPDEPEQLSADRWVIRQIQKDLPILL